MNEETEQRYRAEKPETLQMAEGSAQLRIGNHTKNYRLKGRTKSDAWD